MAMTSAGAVTVIDAWNQRGWSREDHLLDDGPLSALVGRTFRSLYAMRKAAHRLSESYPAVEYTMGSRKYRYDGSANLGIPGRHVPMIEELN